ncbi:MULTISPECIES: hypothetical protein [unclassified Streptomyces]|uniref:hypothetical protein n=1 Tax=unclassified Streptomyces TaxID=2593676 RepID=UPI002E1154F3|nr:MULTISPECIES: hypothetical protein [unclassified Streptomyces]WSR21605.1 hypothetical protein OG573_22390 [Streptomyces sp. NBC_01205]
MSTKRTDGERSGTLAGHGAGESLTGRINHLFSVAGSRDHRGRWQTFGTGEVADLISRSEGRYGVRLSRSYLAMLRSGRYTNPSIAVVMALVRFVNDHLAEGHPEITVDWLTSGATAAAPGPGVDPGAPAADSTALGADMAGALGALADRQVQHIALRAGRMTPELRDRLIAILDTMEGTS